MFHIIIGQSGAGKTTLVRERFIRGQPITIDEDIIPCSYFGEYVALGKYGIGKRTEGTDTLPYNAAPKIKQQLLKLKDKEVILEGDRINNPGIFRFIQQHGIPAKLYLVDCSLGTSMRRLRAAGSTITPAFVKTTKSKARHIFLEWAHVFGGEIINTDKEE